MSMPAVLEMEQVGYLLAALQRRGYRLVGPTVRDGAIVYDEVSRMEDFPVGWTETQEGGTYRLERRADAALFGYTVGPQAWKQFLHPPALRLWQAQRQGTQIRFVAAAEAAPRYAFIGVRACDLHAIAVQDNVFMQGTYRDPTYAARRPQAFLVAVHCSQAGGTCFCASMQIGPRATHGLDLALTDVIELPWHYFVVEAGSDRGADVLHDTPHRTAQ